MAKTTTKYPYAAIDHRVIDSPAFADLPFSAHTLLLLIVRQLTKDNNGHLHATYSYVRKHGIDSEHTLNRAIKALIAHGFIYRTRSGGYQQGAARYAVTWLSITRRDGLFLGGFKPFAWRDWMPPEKKSPPSEVQDTPCKNGIQTPIINAESAGDRPGKTAHIELMPCSSRNAVGEPAHNKPSNMMGRAIRRGGQLRNLQRLDRLPPLAGAASA